MYDEFKLSQEVQREEIILKNKKIILSCLLELKVYDSILQEAMDKLALCPQEDEKQFNTLEKQVQSIDKKIDAIKLKQRVSERTIELV